MIWQNRCSSLEDSISLPETLNPALTLPLSYNHPRGSQSAMLVRFFNSLFLLLSLIVSSAAGQGPNCADVQKRLDRVQASGYQVSLDSNWSDLEPVFGKPSKATPSQNGATLQYDFSECSVEFRIGSQGKVVSKTFKFGLTMHVAPTAGASDSARGSDLAGTVAALRAAVRQLEARLVEVEKLLQASSASTRNSAPLLPEPPALSFTSLSQSPAASATPALIVNTTGNPGCAENGSCYGDTSPATGNPKTVNVNGYYRKDGTYVRGHYRSAPKR